jgi:RNA polymerase sigma factor (sigma-70 family)
MKTGARTAQSRILQGVDDLAERPLKPASAFQWPREHASRSVTGLQTLQIRERCQSSESFNFFVRSGPGLRSLYVGAFSTEKGSASCVYQVENLRAGMVCIPATSCSRRVRMFENDPFQDLIRRVRQGDQEAAAELVRSYEPAIRRAARIRITNKRLQRLFDSADISQSVFASFFVRASLGQYDIDTPKRLLNLLLSMSHKKLINYVRKEQAARRDYRRVEDDLHVQKRILAKDSNPSQQAALVELLREFRARLSPDEQHLTDLRAAGQEWAQIAAQLGEGPEALRKKLARAISRIANELGLDAFDDTQP